MPNAAQQNPKGIVIGLTGPVGSGVSTVAKIIESHIEPRNFIVASLAAPIKEEFCKKYRRTIEGVNKKKDRRKRLQDIGDAGRKKSSDYWIKKAITSKAKDGLVITGIRNYQELQVLRKEYGNFFLIAVTASHETRWKRVRADYDGDERAFYRDDERDADGEIEYGQQVERCVQEADYIFENEDDHPSSHERTEYLKVLTQ
jgi:dephospho-CoA kinase